MSQNFSIKKVRHTGAPVMVDEDEWTANPERIINWLCDGWRARFNQHRAQRKKAVWVDGERVLDADGKPELVTIGDYIPISDAAVRKRDPWLQAMPSLVLAAPERIENNEWFAAVKRRKTLQSMGLPGGKMPSFKRRRDEQRFTCWFNGGKGFTVHRTGRRSGVVRMSGLTPTPHGKQARWALAIHFRMSQGIRDTTSMQVDWMRKRLTFVSPAPQRDHPTTGKTVGVDRGVTHSMALSTGEFIDVPNVSAIEAKRKHHQRAMARSKAKAAADGRQFWESKRYQEHKLLAAKHSEHIANIRKNFAHQTSNTLVRDFDTIVFEDLNIKAMTKAPKAKPDGEGGWLPNGRAAKRGLNKGILDSAWSMTARMCEDKAERSIDRQVLYVPAYNTSRRCHECGHTSDDNRESQAVFVCKRCGWTGNADTNAALNIEADKSKGRTGPALRKSKSKVGDASPASDTDARIPALR